MDSSEMNYFRTKYIVLRYGHTQQNFLDKSKILLEKENSDGSLTPVDLGHDEVKPKIEDIKSVLKGCNICDVVHHRLAECEVCTNPIQNTSVTTCNTCGGFWCGRCTSKIKKCPFCRSTTPKEHCEAISRILKDMSLPCRYFRNGCKTLVTGIEREGHEETCPSGNVICPISYCKCIPPLPELVRHLNKTHEMVTVGASKLRLNLFSYRKKLKESQYYKYSLHMVCFECLFSINIYVNKLDFEIRIRMKKIVHEYQNWDLVCSNVILFEFGSENFVIRESLIISENNEKEYLFQIDEDIINTANNDDIKLTFTVSQIK